MPGASGRRQRQPWMFLARLQPLDRGILRCYYALVYKFHINFPGEAVVAAEREPGGNPGRSGHCKRGAMCKMPLYAQHMRRRTDAEIRKSGNLPEE